jgi:hypothetical protein
MKTDGTIEKSTEHLHTPDNAKNEGEKIKATIRDSAENGEEKPRQIIVNSKTGVSLEAAHLAPSYSASQRTIEWKRKE